MNKLEEKTTLLEKIFKKKIKEYAVIINENGIQQTNKNITSLNNNFKYKQKGYIIKKQEPYFIDTKFFWLTKRIYIYNVNDYEPINLTNINIRLKSDDFNTLLETKILKEANRKEDNVLNDLLTPRNIFIALIVISAIYYFSTGGTIS